MGNPSVDELVDQALSAEYNGEWEEAKKLSRQALDLDPDNYLAHKRMSLALWYSNERDEAMKEMERCLELAPDFESGHYNMACFHAVLGNRDKALASLGRAIELASYYQSQAKSDPDFSSLQSDPEFINLCGDSPITGQDKEASYYKIVHGKKYDRHMLTLADEAIAGQGDGRVSVDDAKKLFKAVADGNAYTDVEKATMAFIRGNYRFTDAADKWFRTEIRKWAATK